MKPTPIYRKAHEILDYIRFLAFDSEKEQMVIKVLTKYRRELTDPLKEQIKKLQEQNKELNRRLGMVPPAYRP